MTQAITFTTSAGEAVAGALAVPSGGAKGALIVVHEWWGINDDIKGLCERFAGVGFAALAVDLFGGRSTTDANEAAKLMTEMKTEDAVEIMRGAVEPLKAHGKVGVTGFCLGGGMTIAAANNVKGLSAAVAFYGVPREDFQNFGPHTAPILGHYGKTDGFIPADKATAMRDKAVAAGAKFDLHLYDAGHAFMRAHDPSVYDAPSAKLAWDRTIAFFTEKLG
jgi:carboxymethylenebutenolidase